MPPVIEVDHLRKRYGVFEAVKDVSFAVQQGEIFGILGPNGAGKTTTLECIQGLREPSAGSIRLLGLDAVTQRPQLRGRIGSQLQDSALPDRLKVWEALDLFASLSPNGPDWRVLLDQWGLTEKAKTSFADLSGGQRQRLFIALALVNDPEVVFLDELTQGLDPGARRVAWDLIRQIREGGTTVVIVTHYMDEAEQLCDRLAVVAGGEVIATGTPQALIANSDRGSRCGSAPSARIFRGWSRSTGSPQFHAAVMGSKSPARDRCWRSPPPRWWPTTSSRPIFVPCSPAWKMSTST